MPYIRIEFVGRVCQDVKLNIVTHSKQECKINYDPMVLHNIENSLQYDSSKKNIRTKSQRNECIKPVVEALNGNESNEQKCNVTYAKKKSAKIRSMSSL
jgi:hypothetical protein